MTSIIGLAALTCIGCLFVINVEASTSRGKKGVSKNNILTVRLTSSDDEKKPVVLKKGSAIKLECVFQSQSWSYVQWVKLQHSDGFRPRVIQANQTYTNGSFQISSVVIEDVIKEDAGNYSCISTSSAGATAFEFYVSVKETFFCDEDLCLPNGECEELLNSYVCNCLSGFVGKHCELEDPCLQNPCLNNGSCAITGDTFTCTCQGGFGGDKCEREVCTPTSCNGGGSCSQVTDGNITCDCRYDRTGKRCQHRCTFSTPNSNRYGCRGKTCVISESGLERCECHRRTHSNYCIMESDVRNECSDSNICNGRGSCHDYTYQYRCDCHSYASGRNCEFYNECGSGNNVCRRNGATCVDLPVGYKCSNCPAGQYGDKCQHKPDPCKVICHQSSAEVKCDMRFLDEKLSSIPIYLNSKLCTLTNSHRYSSGYGHQYLEASKTFTYDSCGTQFKHENGFVVYRNSLRSGEPSSKSGASSIITRITGHFRFDMECRLPLSRNTSSSALSDMSLGVDDTTDLKNSSDINIPTSIQFYNEKWESITKYVVGDRLYVKLYSNSISNSLLRDYGILNPVTCFATSDRDGNGPPYVLLENGCVRDETFRFEKTRRTGYRSSVILESYFSFDSFSFKDNPGKLYLHCNARMCLIRTHHQNETKSNSCEISCVENEVGRETTTTTITTKRPIMSTSDFETIASYRKKRSLGLFSNLLGLVEERSIVDRIPGFVIRLGQGQAPF